jgi:D-alanine-D-alanine ligase
MPASHRSAEKTEAGSPESSNTESSNTAAVGVTEESVAGGRHARNPAELRLLVLAGGLSHERDVSLRSGRRVAESLRECGHEVIERDVDADLLVHLGADAPDCVVLMLHGETGEDGAIREVLDLLGVPYIGAEAAACRVAFDKPVAKELVSRAGVATPRSVCLAAETFRELGARAVIEALDKGLGMPLMVKPARGGSALGCSVVTDAEQLPSALVSAFAYGPTALLEHYVSGLEVAVGVIDRGDGPEALPAIGIHPDGGVYDYTARYTAGATEFEVPARLTGDVARKCAETALLVHRTLGLRELSRSDLIVDKDGTVWFLEANVAPGFTETSLVPLGLEAAGAEVGATIAALANAAVARARKGHQ